MKMIGQVPFNNGDRQTCGCLQFLLVCIGLLISFRANTANKPIMWTKGTLWDEATEPAAKG